MHQDIRDIAYIDQEDIGRLNFIRTDGRYIYRRYFRQGLRSHIVEILEPADVQIEKTGTRINGVLHFPRAIPLKVLRIFRTRFADLDEALNEIQRVKITEYFLTTQFIARSLEMIVEYHGPKGTSILLCGLQDFVTGVIVDPWSLLKGDILLHSLHDSAFSQYGDKTVGKEEWSSRVKKSCRQFVTNIKQMMLEGNHVPDLAGVGNVLLTPAGDFKLVDINNISQVHMDNRIRVDDRKYPVCDKSIEALSLIEEKILGSHHLEKDPAYEIFLKPGRKERVRKLEEKFLQRVKSNQ